MFKVCIILLLLWSSVSYAQSSVTGAVSKNTSVTGTRNVIDSGNSSTYTNNGAPVLLTPSLATANDTCAESFSTGGTGAGFGLSVGKTYVSVPCNTRYNANYMATLGRPDIAMELMCGMDDVYLADQRLAKQNGIQPVCVPRDLTPKPQPTPNNRPSENR